MYLNLFRHSGFIQIFGTKFESLAYRTSGLITVAVDLRSHLIKLISNITHKQMRSLRWQQLRVTIGHVTTQIQQVPPQLKRNQ